MSQRTSTSDGGIPEAATLDEVYRRLSRVYATLAEVDQIDGDLHGRTLDWLMDILDLIDAAPSASPQARLASTGRTPDRD